MTTAVLIGILLLALGSRGHAAPGATIPVHKGRALVVGVAEAMALPDPWTSWLVWVSKGESGWSTGAHNEKNGEVRASAKTYRRLVSQGRWPCPEQPLTVPPTKDAQGKAIIMPPAPPYVIGSGGWYGQLAPLTIHFGNALGFGCDPVAIWRDPIMSTRAHFAQVRGTLQILRSKTNGGGTFLQLRALYGVPTRDPNAVDTPQRRAAYSATLMSAGIDPAFLDQTVPAFPAGV